MPSINAFLCAAHRFAAGTYTIRGTFNGTAQTVTITVSTNSDWFVQGNGSAGSDLLQALETGLNTNSFSTVFDVTISETGRVVLTANHNFSIAWDDVLTTIDKRLFGFTGTTVSAATATGTTTPMSAWVPDQPVMSTNYGDPETVSAIERTISGQTLTADMSADVDAWEFSWMLLDQAKVKDRWASADPLGCIEWLFKNYLRLGREFRLVESIGDPASTYHRLKLIDHRVPWVLEKHRMMTSYGVQIHAREAV